MKLRDYQLKALNEVNSILYKNRVCYLAGEVRTGKTLVALHVASKYKKTLFVTRKKAISSINQDVKNCGLKIDVTIVNYEQIHKINFIPDLIVYDEAHNLGKFPKPAKKTVAARNMFGNIPTLLLSGTPSPESYSQLFHQFWVTKNGPWSMYKNFYEWARVYVNVVKKFVGSGQLINTYNQTKPIVLQEFNSYKVSMTQKDAKFNGEIIEVVHNIELPEICKEYISSLKKKKISGTLVADSGSRLMSFIHQISSGTVINNDGFSVYLSDFKAKYIKDKFKGKKLAIFYCYVAEGNLLKTMFNTTTDPVEFKNNDKLTFISQVSSGREGINLSIADEIIFFNISYSAVSYWQARARSQSIDGGDRKVHWLFSKDGIESKIYDLIKTKKVSYTLSHFRKTYGYQGKKLSFGI